MKASIEEQVETGQTHRQIKPIVRPKRFNPAIYLARQDKIGLVAVLTFSTVILCALLAPLLTPYEPNFQHRQAILQPPSGRFWFGTDDLGRDVFTRLLYGARTSVFIGLSVVASTVVVGGMIGILSGYIGGVFDQVVQRFVDALYSLPSIVLALFIAALLGASVRNVILAISIVQIPRFIRIARAEALRVRSLTFIDSARLVGARRLTIIVGHVIPNSMSALLVMASLVFGIAILTAAALTFLGVGNPPPNPSLGGMLARSQIYVSSAPWLVIAPGIVLTATVASLNLIGDSIRDMFDPRIR